MKIVKNDQEHQEALIEIDRIVKMPVRSAQEELYLKQLISTTSQYVEHKRVANMERGYTPSRRDFFAAHALTGYMAHYGGVGNVEAKRIVRSVDELINELDNKK